MFVTVPRTDQLSHDSPSLSPRNNTLHPPLCSPHRSSSGIGGLVAAISKGEEELSSLRTAVHSLEHSLCKEKMKIKEYKTKKTQENQSLLTKLKDERSQRRELREQLASASREIEKQACDILNLTCALSECQQRIQRSNDMLLEKEIETDRYKAQCERLQGDLYRAQEEVAFLKVELSSDRHTASMQHEQLVAAREAVEQQTIALSMAARVKKQTQGKVLLLEQEKIAQRVAFEELQKKLETSQSQLQDVKQILKASSTRFQAANVDKITLMKRLNECKAKEAKQAASITALQEKLQTTQQLSEATQKELIAQLHETMRIKKSAVRDAEKQRAALIAVSSGFEHVATQLATANCNGV